MVLQVHDELLFEVPVEESNEVEELVRAEMEGVVELKAPLVADWASARTGGTCNAVPRRRYSGWWCSFRLGGDTTIAQSATVILSEAKRSEAQ